MTRSLPFPTALTIAGSDSGGGAGIQADLKAFHDHGVFGMSAITAVTAQNLDGVRRVDLVPVEGLVAQLDAVFEGFPVGAIKIGMLGTAAHAIAVVRYLLERRQPLPPLVVDPVMVATSGARLLEREAEQVIARRLIPMATVSTPNLAEAAVLAAGEDVTAWALRQRRPILITGGDAAGEEVVDLLVRDGAIRRLAHPRIPGGPFHGSGCTLASAIAARLAKGDDLATAVDSAIAYVRDRIAAGRLWGRQAATTL